MTDDDHPVVIEPTIEGLISMLAGTEMLYIHSMEGKMIAIVIPAGGWWQEQMPEAPLEHFAHDHVRIDGRVP